MATVQVSTLEEFVAAVAVAGNTVVCPENEDWDANDIYPNGKNGDFVVAANITGNGTTFRNLRVTLGITNPNSSFITIENFNFVDVIGGRPSQFGAAGLFYGMTRLVGCKVSAVLNSNYNRIIQWTNSGTGYAADRCSFVIDASGNFQTLTYGEIRYSRLELHLPNNQENPFSSAGGKCYTSEIAIYSPNAPYIYSHDFVGCIIHGEMPNAVERSSGQWPGDMTLYSTDGLPNFSPANPDQCVGVTDAQLRDPAYLRSIGFPIAIGG